MAQCGNIFYVKCVWGEAVCLKNCKQTAEKCKKSATSITFWHYQHGVKNEQFHGNFGEFSNFENAIFAIFYGSEFW